MNLRTPIRTIHDAATGDSLEDFRKRGNMLDPCTLMFTVKQKRSLPTLMRLLDAHRIRYLTFPEGHLLRDIGVVFATPRDMQQFLCHSRWT